MSASQQRTEDGARAAYQIVEALSRKDITAAAQIAAEADPVYTMVALGSAWTALTEYAQLPVAELLSSMRTTMAERSRDGGEQG